MQAERSEHLARLREITPTLQATFPSVVSESNGFKEHKMACGTSFSWDLLDREELSCAHWFNSNGSTFPVHSHEGREWVIVFKGSMYITIKETTKRLMAGQSIIIEPLTKHSAKFSEDCHYIAIVIPKTEDWPTS